MSGYELRVQVDVPISFLSFKKFITFIVKGFILTREHWLGHDKRGAGSARQDSWRESYCAVSVPPAAAAPTRNTRTARSSPAASL